MGYSFTEITKERVKGVMTITKKVTKKLAPDVIAMIFWMKNRRPDKWRDRREVEHSGEIKSRAAQPDYSDYTDEDWDNLERLSAKAHNGNGKAASRN